MENSQLEKIKNRQLARFLNHLKKTRQLTPGLESDVKRAYNYAFQDVHTLIFGTDKEIEDGEKPCFSILPE